MDVRGILLSIKFRRWFEKNSGGKRVIFFDVVSHPFRNFNLFFIDGFKTPTCLN